MIFSWLFTSYIEPHVLVQCTCLASVDSSSVRASSSFFFREIYILYMIYRVQYILLGCLKHSLPCSIQQTTSQGCDNTWFLRIICTLYSHHLHHHRCKKWGGIGGTFLVSNLVLLGGGSQNKVMLCTKLDAYSLSNLAKS